MDLPAYRYRATLDQDASTLTSAKMISLQQLNAATSVQFVAELAGIFERSPWVAERHKASNGGRLRGRRSRTIAYYPLIRPLRRLLVRAAFRAAAEALLGSAR